ncbi:MAG: tyrosine-type recombinase/integrase [Actinomycetota bacterium]
MPESLEPADVRAFLADLRTHRDRSIVLMVFGGLRSAEVRSLKLSDVDQGRRRVRVVGKGGRERTVPDRPQFRHPPGGIRRPILLRIGSTGHIIRPDSRT